MMRRIAVLLAAAGALLAASPSFADEKFPSAIGGGQVDPGHVMMCLDSSGKAIPFSSSCAGTLPVAGTFSASLGGFTPSAAGARGTPFTVNTIDSSGTLPTGTVVVVSNVGTTNPMYCNVNGVAATAADQLISANGGWFQFTIPAAITTLHCIATGGTTTANMVGGSGLPTGTGGGSGGGGGAATIADGADVAEGATTDAAAAAGGTGTISAKLREISAQLAGASPCQNAATPTTNTYVAPGPNPINCDLNGNLYTHGQGQGASGSALVGNPFRVGLSDGTNNQNWLAAIALADGVNGNNTGAVGPWWFNGTTWDRARGDATNGEWVNIKSSVGLSINNFLPGASYATLTSTASSADAALPTGASIVLANTGTSAVSCSLSVGAGTAVASRNVIQPASWMSFAVGTNTHYQCINQAGDSASNVVVASGGSGIPNGSGGGSGGGGGGAVTIADGADVTLGATADAAATAGGTGTISAKLREVTALLNTINTAIGQPTTALAATTSATNTYANAATSVLNTDLHGALYTLSATTGPTTGTVTTQDLASTSTAGYNSVALITGAATAGSTFAVAINSQSDAKIQLTGTWTGTVNFEFSEDNGTTWVNATARQRGASFFGGSATGNGIFQIDVSSATNIRVRAVAAMTGTVNISITTSGQSNAVQVLNGVREYDNANNTFATIKPASTPAADTDTALVVAERPMSIGAGHFIVAANDNHQVIKNGAGVVFMVSVTALSSFAGSNYIRLYDAGTGFNGCNSATGLIGGFVYSTPGIAITLAGSHGVSFANGLSVCVTANATDTDTANATAGPVANISWK